MGSGSMQQGISHVNNGGKQVLRRLFESAMMTVNYNGKTDVKIGFDRKDKTGKMFIILFRI